MAVSEVVMNTKNEPKRVGIWVRVSTEDQVRGESPETHERRARLYAEAKGWNVVEVYRLDAVSGKTVKDTPEAKRMLIDVQDGHITGLIFSKLARLARNTKELLEFSEIFRDCGADLISLAESIDTSTPAGRLFYTMIAAMAQWEREEISERVAAAVPIRAKAGQPTGGQAPFGYEWRDKKLYIDPAEAKVRKLIFELFREHKRKKLVARLLNDQGYRTRNGGKFSDTTVDRLLRDPIAMGTRRANYTCTKDNNKAWKLKPESEWVYLKVEPIVSEELWQECNQFLDEQRSKLKRVTKSAVYLFSGLAYCICGKKMYVPSNSPKYTCKECRNKIPVDDLEAVFHEQIKNFLVSEKEIVNHLEQANVEVKEKVELLGVLEKETNKLNQEIDKLYDLYQSSMIDKHGFGLKYKPLAERREQLDEQIPKLQAEIDIMKISQLSQEVAIAEARDLYGRWPSLPFAEKRRIVEAIVEKITIGNGEIEINLFYTPPASEIPQHNLNNGGITNIYSSLNHGNLATDAHRRVAFLPFVRTKLKSLIPKSYDFEPKALGEHLLKRRLFLELSQAEVGKLFNVCSFTVGNWEKGHSEPKIFQIPILIEFLGYDPINHHSNSIAELLLAKRKKLGWTQKVAAKNLGVDPCTWSSWECGRAIKTYKHRRLVAEFLNMDEGVVDVIMKLQWNELHER